MSSDSLSGTEELPNQLSAVDQSAAQEMRLRNNNVWRSNYHEASIYIEEGLNNDKFENHPKKRVRKVLPASDNPSSQAQQAGCSARLSNADDKSSLENGFLGAENNLIDNNNSKKHGFILGGQYTTIETYILVHNRYFYQLDLAASIILLLLALVEPPALDGYELTPKIHAAIEMFALGIIAIELLLKFRWMGPRRFFRHGRTVTKLAVLLAMNFEAIVIFLRHSVHARYSRALRPIFLIDNHYCHGLRRAVRQIFQSLPPIIDMFTLALFFMFVFSIFGYYLFASNNYYFSDMPATIGNLLILATTANLPDVMMPSYAVSRWSALFFVLFVIIFLFLFTNLTMAAVYEIFTRKEKQKFHKLLLHRRKACQEAFKLLVSRRQPTRIQYRQFMGLMRYLNRDCSMLDAYLIFKALDTDRKGSISLEEFYQIYDFINLEWKLIYPQFKWYDDYECLPCFCLRFLVFIERIFKHRLFEWIIDLLIAVQALLQFVEATASGQSAFKLAAHQVVNNQTTTAADSNQQSATSLTGVQPDMVGTYVFMSIYVIEAMIRCLVSGPREYWRNLWNRFDLLVLTVSLIGLINGLLGGQPFGWVMVLRLLRLCRLFEYKRRYRDMWQTLTYILLKRFVGMTCVVMILYYFFAIIGMELLGDYDLRNCCKNSTLESQFKFDADSSTLDNGLIRYYLNDFGDLVASYLTLFSLSSNTYWLTLMNAYAIVSGSFWVRIFFGLYYLCSIIVMNIVIAFILESFLFRIHYRNKMGDNCDNTNLFTVSVTLSSFEVDFLLENLGSSRGSGASGARLAAAENGRLCMQGLEKTVAKLRRVNDDNKRLLSRSCSPSISSSSSSSSLVGKIIGDDYIDNYPDNDDLMAANERTSLLGNARVDHHKQGLAMKQKRPSPLVRDDNSGMTKVLNGKQQHSSMGKQPREKQNNAPQARRPEYYLIYQAEQIRNKFSYTMKMYADEVGPWLAEAERADQDAMSVMISRNQLRAEHVAMARLARRNLADLYHRSNIVSGGALADYQSMEKGGAQVSAGAGPLAGALAADCWFRPRSYSTSTGALNGDEPNQQRTLPRSRDDK